MALAALLDRRRLPWAAPVIAVASVAAVALAPRAFAGDPSPSLPPRSAGQLIAAVDASTVRQLSGTLESTPGLGLPQLPGADGGNQISTLLTEPATWTVAVSGPDRVHVALDGKGKEMDVIRDGSSVWTWDSSTQDAAHYLLPPESSSTKPSTDTTAEPTPAALAQKVLDAVDPSTQLAVGASAVVAGRDVYTLVVTPRTSATLIGRAVIDVDAANGVPLGVAVYPRGGGSAGLRETFTSVSFAAPPASAFAFTPPPGATVTTHDLSSGSGGTGAVDSAAKGATTSVVGTGWTSVVRIEGLPAGSLG
ncbi:MAG: rane protein, partial [Frankiales bacterium]|nr:rane protein [Frankiales bacterium]